MKAERLPSGNYRVKIYIGKVNGKKKWISDTAPTRSEAERRGAMLSNTDWTQTTVEAACFKYLHFRGSEISPATLRGYEGTFNSKIKNDIIGGVRLGKLTSAKVQDWLNRMDTTKKTKRNHLGFLTASLNFAGYDRKLRIRLSDEEAKQLYTPTADEVNAVLDLLDEETHLAACFACLGLRRGEICALTRDDIDGLTVRITKDTVKNSSGEWIVKAPKTQKSRREVQLPKEMLDLLPDDGKIIKCSPDCITNRFARAVKKSGVHPFRFHDLRSFSASAMLSEIKVARSTAKAVHGWKTDRMLDQHYDREIADVKRKDEKKIVRYISKNIHIKRNG